MHQFTREWIADAVREGVLPLENALQLDSWLAENEMLAELLGVK